MYPNSSFGRQNVFANDLIFWFVKIVEVIVTLAIELNNWCKKRINMRDAEQDLQHTINNNKEIRE